MKSILLASVALVATSLLAEAALAQTRPGCMGQCKPFVSQAEQRIRSDVKERIAEACGPNEPSGLELHGAQAYQACVSGLQPVMGASLDFVRVLTEYKIKIAKQ